MVNTEPARQRMNGIPHYALLTVVLAALLPRKRAWLAIPVSLLFWAPLQPHFIGIVRGALGELSVGSWILTVLIFLKIIQRKPILELPGIKPTAALISVVSIFLYGNFIGLLPLGDFHPYESAFFSPFTLIAFCIFAAIASWKGWLWPSLWVILSLLVWLFSIHPSQNPWDCLLDPVVSITCIIITIRNFFFRQQ